MARCNHQNFTVTTGIKQRFRHVFEDGQYVHQYEKSDECKTVLVECEDCWLERSYSMSRLPKWLHDALNAVYEDENRVAFR